MDTNKELCPSASNPSNESEDTLGRSKGTTKTETCFELSGLGFVYFFLVKVGINKSANCLQLCCLMLTKKVNVWDPLAYE